MSTRVRRATPADAAAITAMIHGLADFERAGADVQQKIPNPGRFAETRACRDPLDQFPAAVYRMQLAIIQLC